MAIKFEGYSHIGIQKGVCGSRPTIVGRQLEPEFIVRYGTIEEAIEDFDLERKKVEECHRFMQELNAQFIQAIFRRNF